MSVQLSEQIDCILEEFGDFRDTDRVQVRRRFAFAKFAHPFDGAVHAFGGIAEEPGVGVFGLLFQDLDSRGQAVDVLACFDVFLIFELQEM